MINKRFDCSLENHHCILSCQFISMYSNIQSVWIIISNWQLIIFYLLIISWFLILLSAWVTIIGFCRTITISLCIVVPTTVAAYRIPLILLVLVLVMRMLRIVCNFCCFDLILLIVIWVVVWVLIIIILAIGRIF
jgi:hypothetical protein